MNRCIVYKKSFKLFHFTLVTPWQCKYAFGVCLVILEIEKCRNKVQWLWWGFFNVAAGPKQDFCISPLHFFALHTTKTRLLLPFLPAQSIPRSWLGLGSHRIGYRLCPTWQNYSSDLRFSSDPSAVELLWEAGAGWNFHTENCLW